MTEREMAMQVPDDLVANAPGAPSMSDADQYLNLIQLMSQRDQGKYLYWLMLNFIFYHLNLESDIYSVFDSSFAF